MESLFSGMSWEHHASRGDIIPLNTALLLRELVRFQSLASDAYVYTPMVEALKLVPGNLSCD